MLKLRFTNSFKKDYKLMKRRGFDLSLLDVVVETLLKGEKLETKY
ncbi:MAG: type II toxin-antitoxin system YafQ family toxin, partial [Spirochaetales bacterium]|nr:type II toxin-antitoxin system YafQ family toxin [Spirochaetales bacterium]